MSKLPDNDIFDNPFSNTAVAKAPSPAPQKKRKPKPSPKLAVVEPKAPAATATAATTSPERANQGIKKTVYVSAEQLKGLHIEVHKLLMDGKNGREANLSKVITNAIDFYLARSETSAKA